MAVVLSFLEVYPNDGDLGAAFYMDCIIVALLLLE